MARYCYLRLSSMYATGLENKRGHKAQSPRVAFLISPGCRRVLSSPARNGGEDPRWYDAYTLLFEEDDYEAAKLTMILFHKGKNYDTILGEVRDIRVSNLTLGHQRQFPVLNESGMHGGGFLNFCAKVVRPPSPTQQSFTVRVYYAQGLKNVKSFWKRISVESRCVRKMKPYVVAESNLNNEQWVSPVAESGGRNPEFNFRHTFTCNESLIQQDRVNVTIKLHHRHKAEYNRGSSDWDRFDDMLIGTVENIKVSQMEQRRREYRVRTPKRKDGGILCVSVALGEPEQQEHLEQEYSSMTPSLINTSWQPRIRPRRPGLFGVRLDQLFRVTGPASRMILAGVGIAAAVA